MADREKSRRRLLVARMVSGVGVEGVTLAIGHCIANGWSAGLA